LPLQGRRVLLIIAGGIAAYKSLDLIRRLRERGAAVRVVMTRGAQQFITPLSAASLSADRVYTDLFSLTEESEMGHLRLAAEADLVVVAPATADLLAKMAAGLADDLASTALLATDKAILIAPAMNTRMWRNAATQANVAVLEQRGVQRVGPNSGPLAEGETGAGRMAEPLEIVAAVQQLLGGGALKGRRAIVTSGPTHEAIDPVRYIANRSSGKQGHAIAAALARAGAETVLVSGPTSLADPPGVRVVHVQSAREMLAACEKALPADIAVCAAAVADWRVDAAPQKLKKKNSAPPTLKLVENPDILASLSKSGNRRPRLVVGFAAETEKVVEHAREKRAKKGCDWILANDVSPATGTFGGDANTVHVIDEAGVENWPPLSKRDVAERLAQRIGLFFERKAAE
jgi:phosphopantothenoylcysteine decarboxylase / phosphopantothenate---cysteine ligase